MAALALRSLDRSYILSAIGVILFVVASLVLTSLVTPTLVFPIVQLPLPSNPSSRQSTTAVDCVIPNVSPLNDVTNSTGPSSCDLFRGQWVADSDLDPPKVPPFNCPIRNPPWNCEDNHKPAPLTQSLVWKPDGCALRPYGDTAGLESLRGKTVGCLGDSLCHNFHETLVCQVKDTSL